jgi:putative tricarboxylic transport membrane protein
MDVFANLALGFSVSLTLENLAFCLIGAVVGTAIGVLPGLGPAATIAILLPITFKMDPISAIIMLAGIYYGAMYGGSITSILVKVPGEAASVVTCLDGYEMARKGRAGAALGISAFGSLIAGVFATFSLAFLGPYVAGVALDFGPPEYAALVALGLLLVTLISSTSMLRSLMMVMVGLLFSTIGLDPISGAERFTFGRTELFDGLNIAIMAMGLFGIAELLYLASRQDPQASFIPQPSRLRDMLPNRRDWKDSAGPIGRGSVLGFLLGLLPGGGAILASFASYVLERRVSRHPEKFGTGVIEGVAGPESANNAAAQGAFVPLLTLGIPANVVMGVLMGALMIHGLQPGPLLLQESPQLFWGVITSMFIGNLILVFLNVPMVGVFVRLLKIPYAILAPLIILFCVIGAYSVNINSFDVGVMVVLGVVAFLLKRVNLDPAPLLLAYVLGDLFENAVRQSLLLSHGSLAIFVQRPISGFLVGVGALLLAASALRWLAQGARRRARAAG